MSKKFYPRFRVLRFYEEKAKYNSLDEGNQFTTCIRLAIRASIRSKIPTILTDIGRNQIVDKSIREICSCGFSGFIFHLRMNWSLEEILEVLEKIHINITLYDIYPRTPAVCVTTKGSTVCGGPIKDGRPIQLKYGDSICLTSLQRYELESCREVLYIDYLALPFAVAEGHVLYIENGSIPLRVETIKPFCGTVVNDKNTVYCTVLLDGFVHDYTVVYFKDHTPDLPHIRLTDLITIMQLLPYGLSTIFLSKCYDPETIKKIRTIIDSTKRYDSSKFSIYASISLNAAVEKLDEIIDLADGIVVDRFQLSCQIGPHDAFFLQRNILFKCIKKGKVVLSPLDITPISKSKKWRHYIPRAPQEDITNMYLEGLDGAIVYGSRFRTKQLIRNVTSLKFRFSILDSYVWNKELYNAYLHQFPTPNTLEQGLAIAVLQTAFQIDGSAIIFFENDGRFAQIIARIKPRCAVLVITTSALNARNLVLHKSLTPILTKDRRAKNWEATQDMYIQKAIDYAKERDIVQSRDPIVAVFRSKISGLFSDLRCIYLSSQ